MATPAPIVTKVFGSAEDSITGYTEQELKETARACFASMTCEYLDEKSIPATIVEQKAYNSRHAMYMGCIKTSLLKTLRDLAWGVAPESDFRNRMQIIGMLAGKAIKEIAVLKVENRVCAVTGKAICRGLSGNIEGVLVRCKMVKDDFCVSDEAYADFWPVYMYTKLDSVARVHLTDYMKHKSTSEKENLLLLQTRGEDFASKAVFAATEMQRIMECLLNPKSQ